ncbi:MAG: adenylosuccinate synthetase, partial [Candidatus Ranarchaeia archaeon]
MPCKVVVGGFYGDEGKGKIMSYLAIEEKPAILVRAGVGPNAGHTVEYQGRQYKLRQVPCGFVSPDTRLLIGAGVLV